MPDLSDEITPERFAQIRRILEGAVELPAGGRRSYLEAECRGDSDLRRQVESMLQAAEDSHAMLDQPAIGLETELTTGGNGMEPALSRRRLERGYKLSHFEILQLICPSKIFGWSAIIGVDQLLFTLVVSWPTTDRSASRSVLVL